jgi:anti-anti-sigma factor
MTSPAAWLDRTEVRGDQRTLVLSGELDMAEVPRLQEVLGSAVAVSAAVDVDLTSVTFIDSTVISTLIAARRTAAAAGKRFAVVRSAGHVRHVLEVAGVLELLSTDASAT